MELQSIHLDLQKSRNVTAERLDSVDQKFDSLYNQLVGIRDSTAQNSDAIYQLEKNFTHKIERLLHGEKELLKVTPSTFRHYSSPLLSISNAQESPLKHDIVQQSPFEAQNRQLGGADIEQGIFSIWAIYRNRTCPDVCSCTCHSVRKRSTTWKSPSFFSRLLGSFFATYTGSPTWGEACDSRICHRRASKTLEVAYDFPLWFVNCNIHALIHTEATGSPAMNLVFRQRVPYRVGGIFQAVDSNNMDLLRAILKRNPDSINFRLFKSGHTALHFACLRPQNISFAIFQLLLRAGAALNAEADDGRSVTSIIACQILQKGFPAEHENEISKWCSTSQYIEELELSFVTEVVVGLRYADIKTLLWKYPASRLKLTKFDNTGSTPLYWASRAGDLGAVQDLVNFGVDINQMNALGNTPLMGSFAFDRGLACLSWLLDNGSDPYLTNKDGYNALTLACYFGRLDVVKHLMTRWFKPDAQDGKNRTGLCCAVSYDQVHIVEYLLNAGANVNLVNDWGFVPLFDSVRANSHKCLPLLFRSGANYRFIGSNGWSILHFAAAAGDAETMAILAEQDLKGVVIQGRTFDGYTAEDIFLSRRLAESNKLLVVFRNLLAAISKAANDIHAESEAGEEKEAEDVFFDALS